MDHLDKPYDILLNVLQLDQYRYKMKLISIEKKKQKKCFIDEFEIFLLGDFLYLIRFRNKFVVLIH
jgi:hypothetical protein